MRDPDDRREPPQVARTGSPTSAADARSVPAVRKPEPAVARRALLGGLPAAAFLSLGPARAAPAPERWIWMVNQRGEEIAAAYRAGESYDPLSLARLQFLLRDLRENMPGPPVPPLLVDMLSLLQEEWGYRWPFRVTSGFRTPRTNALLEGAAPASFHLSGRAVDISVRGVPPLDLALSALGLSRKLGFMGLGLYPRFVHLDIGPQRIWTRL